MDYDPWDWTRHPSTAPISNTLQVPPVSEAQPIQQIPNQPDPLMSMVTGKLVDKGLDKVASIWDKPAAAATNMTAPVFDAVPATVADIAAGGTSSLTPIVGAEAATTMAAGPLSTGLAGVESVLGAMGPVGWGIGGVLLAKKLGLF